MGIDFHCCYKGVCRSRMRLALLRQTSDAGATVLAESDPWHQQHINRASSSSQLFHTTQGSSIDAVMTFFSSSASECQGGSYGTARSSQVPLVNRFGKRILNTRMDVQKRIVLYQHLAPIRQHSTHESTFVAIMSYYGHQSTTSRYAPY